MKIYTRTGDRGETSLYDGTRVEKDNLRVECYGTIDELTSNLGLARSFINEEAVGNIIYKIQQDLFIVASELASSDNTKLSRKITEGDIILLETLIDEYDEYIEKTPQVKKFIVPGSNPSSAALHVARTVCRRAERRILTFSRHDTVDELLLMYINRLSDCIFMIAKYLENKPRYMEF